MMTLWNYLITICIVAMHCGEQHPISLKRGQAILQGKTRYKIPPPVKGEILPPRFVELLVVVHWDGNRFHGDGTKKYVMSILDQAAGLWSDVKRLGVNVTIGVTKTIFFDEGAPLPVMADATQLLRKFCTWQKEQTALFLGHYDAAVLITRENIHISNNYNATGLAYMVGACDIDFRCAVVEDSSPMDTAITVAHELGHLLGMYHDSQFNACPDRLNLMSGYTVSGMQSVRWSTCSTESLLKQLRLPRSNCLKDVPLPGTVRLLDRTACPGKIYDSNDQCRIAFGPGARACQNKGTSLICLHLRCVLPDSSKCVPTNRPVLDGTACAINKWCHRGYCVAMQSGHHGDEHKSVAIETTTPIRGDTPAMQRTTPTMRWTEHAGPL